MSAAELDALASEAEAPPPPGPGARQAPGIDDQQQLQPVPGNFEAIAFLLAGFREVGSAILKVQSLRRTLDDPNVEKCARALAPVADRYGLQLGGMLGGPELMAVMTAGPILWGAWRELDLELKQRRAEKGEPVVAPPPAAPPAPADDYPRAVPVGDGT